MATSERLSNARAAVFAPLDQLSRAETVTRRLTDAIHLGLLADGEQLPSESELAGLLGVSTVTIREALTTLRQQRLIETRRGRRGGSFVQAPAKMLSATLRDRLRELTLGDLRDLGDQYCAVAGATAKLAAERASEEDVARLRATIASAHDGSQRRAERTFHLEVAASSQSPRLTREEVGLQGELGALLWLPSNEEGAAELVTESHESIAAVIAAGDGVRARELTEQHILDAVQNLARIHLQTLAP